LEVFEGVVASSLGVDSEDHTGFTVRSGQLLATEHPVRSSIRDRDLISLSAGGVVLVWLEATRETTRLSNARVVEGGLGNSVVESTEVELDNVPNGGVDGLWRVFEDGISGRIHTTNCDNMCSAISIASRTIAS
jgi:hypothetical protein